MRVYRWSLILFGLITTSALAGQTHYYRWTDEQGTVHYSAQPPSGVTAERRSTRYSEGDPSATSPAATANAPSQREESELCRGARANLELLNDQSPLETINDAGETQLMDDTARAQARAREEKIIERHCQP